MTAVAVEEEPKLAREYGFDISMQDNSMAVSTSALKEYQKRVSLLYNEFIKNMNGHLREETKVKKVFNQLRKEKLLNSQYSLYRSDGADLFSKAKESRSKLMENFVRMSPIVLDDYQNLTPWGLDMIIDEDLIGPASVCEEEEIRPLTAPAAPIGSEEQNNESEPEDRPCTVLPLANAIGTAMKSMNLLQLTNTVLGKREDTPEPAPVVTNTAWNALKDVVKEKEEVELPQEELEPGIDGHIDMKLDQTKARKIMIKPKAFEKLTNGKVCVKLKEKSGNFIMKPAPINYKPDAIAAYFMAKDPNKEIMALVRKKTTCASSTISSDMKVNNKIPIMKSLLGQKEVKKTTVAEIMSEARSRKTKQYKVILKNYRQEPIDPDKKIENSESQENNNASFSSSPLPSARNKVDTSDIDPVLNEKNLKRQLHQDLEKHNMECIQDRIKIVMEAWGKNGVSRPVSVLTRRDYKQQNSNNDSVFHLRLPSQSFDANRDKASLSQPRVKFSDEYSHTPLNRSTSSLSFRENMDPMYSSRSPPDAMRLMVDNKRPESRSESIMSYGTGYGSLNRLPKRSKTPNRRFPSRFTPNSYDSYSEISSDAPAKFVSSRDAQKMIKEQIKKDKEKEKELFSLRRKMATAAAGKFNPRTRKF